MPMKVRQYGLRDMQALQSFTEMSFTDSNYIVDLVPGAWDDMERLQSFNEFAVARFTLLEYISAAYALGEFAAYQHACGILLKHSLHQSRTITPPRDQFSVDLAVAISRNEINVARDIATVVLPGPELSEEDNEETIAAFILAALLDLDYAGALKASDLLFGLCSAKKFSKHDCAIFSHWARAASALARRDENAFVQPLAQLTELHRQYAEKELGRWQRGLATELSSIHLWDWLTTALVGMAASFGYQIAPRGDISYPFFSYPWTCTSE